MLQRVANPSEKIASRLKILKETQRFLAWIAHLRAFRSNSMFLPQGGQVPQLCMRAHRIAINRSIPRREVVKRALLTPPIVPSQTIINKRKLLTTKKTIKTR